MRLLYFAPVRWRSYAQRPQHMVRYLVARAGCEVLWVNPYPARLPRWADRHRLRMARAVTSPPAAPNVIEFDVPAWPVEPLPASSSLNARVRWPSTLRVLAAFAADGPCLLGIGRPSALALWALRNLPIAGSFYDAMDDFPEFYQGLSRQMSAYTERAIARGVDRLLVCSEVVRAKFAGAGLSPEHVPNACDPDALPTPVARPVQPYVLGFVGTIGPWFDWAAVARLATECPEARVPLIGPCFAPPPHALPANVEPQGELPHREAMSAVRAFSAGLIPFRDCPVARAMDPVKFYEYRAMGLPVLATPVGEMARREGESGVHLLPNHVDWKTWVVGALRPDDAAEAARTFRTEHTWSRRFDAARLGALTRPRPA